MSNISTEQHNERKQRWPALIFMAGLLLILYITLFPFGILLPENVALSDIFAHFDRRMIKSGFILDIIANIVLFLPFGFSLACLLNRHSWNRIAILTIILLAGFSLSMTVEILQVFIPLRDPDFSDILFNSVGALLGAYCFFAWGHIIGYHITHVLGKVRQLSKYVVSGVMVAYLVAMLFISVSLQHLTHLGNWSVDFPLIVGNEQTGDRPWQGSVTELTIGSQALAREEIAHIFALGDVRSPSDDTIVAFYQLIGSGPYPDLSGHGPDLVWQNTPPVQDLQAGVILSSDHWLTTEVPMTALTSRVGAASQFTLNIVVAAHTSDQSGPARVISISRDPYQRNLTLGQEKSDLLVRLRTPFTGDNGKRIELLIPDVFADTAQHRLIVTYDGNTLHVYVDDVQTVYTLRFSPEFIFFQLLPPVSTPLMYPSRYLVVIYKFLYYGLIFIPLSLILTLISIQQTSSWRSRLLIISGGILISAMLLEMSLAMSAGRNFQVAHVTLSIGIAMGSILLYMVSPMKVMYKV